MNLTPPSILLAVFVLSLAIGGSGCTADSRKARRLQEANRHFKAQDYDSAEIEYLNVLKIDRLNADAIAQLGIIYSEQGRLGRVFTYLSKARELQPNNLEVRMRLAMVHATSGRPADARQEVLFVLQQRPDHPEAPLLLAEIAMDPAQAQETKTQLNALPGEIASSAPVLTALGIMEGRQRNFDQARALFERAAAADPKFADAQIGLGAIYTAQNNLPKAETAFASAAALSPIRSSKRIQYVKFKLQAKQPDEARAQLEEITKKAPDYLPGWLLTAEMSAAQQKYDEALAAIGKVWARDAIHPDASLLSGRVYLAKGEPDKAIALLEAAVSTYRKSAVHHHMLGLAYAARPDLGKAVASLTEAVTLVPTYAPAIIALAEINLRQGNATAAVTALRQLVQKLPSLVEARLLLANAYRAQRNYEEALTVYRQIEQAFPRNAQIPLLIGVVHVQQNKNAEARQAFERALQLAPDFTSALEQIVDLDLRERKFTAARERLTAYSAKNPTAAVPYLLLAKTYLAERDTANAETMLQKAISLQPDQVSAYLLLARIYISTKQQDKAISNLQQAVKNEPKNFEAPMMIAVLQEQQQNFAAARENYEKVLAINPRGSAALNNLAYLYSERFNEPNKAFELAQRARELLPNDPHAADTFGWILYKRRQYTWALTLLSESAEKLPAAAEVQYHLGMTHYMLGEEQAARAALERALKLDETFLGAEDARRALDILRADSSGDAKTLAKLEQHIAKQADPVALNRLGALYEQRGNSEKATVAYENALKASPNNVRAALGMIRIHQQRNETAKAMELAKSARKLAPTDPDVASALGALALRSGDSPWAASLFQETLRSKPTDPEALYAYGQAAYYSGQVNAAQDAVQRALETSPTFSKASEARDFDEFIVLGQDGGKALAAADRIERFLKTAPNHGPALMALGVVKEQQRDAAAAIQTYERALTHYPNFSPARRRLAILLAEHRPAEAKSLEVATKARELFPKDAEVAKALGMLLFRQGNHSRSASLLEESARTRTDDPEVQYYLGMAQRELKNRPGSMRSLQRALELNLKPDLAAKAREALAQTK